MKKSVNFAILGCGRVSPKHLDALTGEVKGAKLVAVCDNNVEKARGVGEKYSLPYYDKLLDMLSAHPEIDVVNILTPSGLHAKHACLAMLNGKHVVVEKPMSLTIDDAEEMIKTSEELGVRLFVVKQNRYNLPVQKLSEAVKGGRFGKMVMGTVRVRWCRTQKYYDQDQWRGTWEMDGGVITNQASHHIDLLTWLMGDVQSVFAYTTTRLVDVEVDDTAVAVLKFTNGALGVIEATTATRPKDLEGSISILGENGSVEIGGFAVNRMKTWQFSDSTPEEIQKALDESENPPNVYGFGHTRFLQEVVNTLASSKKHGMIVDGYEGLRSLVLINAMYESMETGREVTLRFRADHVKLGKQQKNLRSGAHP